MILRPKLRLPHFDHTAILLPCALLANQHSLNIDQTVTIRLVALRSCLWSSLAILVSSCLKALVCVCASGQILLQLFSSILALIWLPSWQRFYFSLSVCLHLDVEMLFDFYFISSSVVCQNVTFLRTCHGWFMISVSSFSAYLFPPPPLLVHHISSVVAVVGFDGSKRIRPPSHFGSNYAFFRKVWFEFHAIELRTRPTLQLPNQMHTETKLQPNATGWLLALGRILDHHLVFVCVDANLDHCPTQFDLFSLKRFGRLSTHFCSLSWLQIQLGRASFTRCSAIFCTHHSLDTHTPILPTTNHQPNHPTKPSNLPPTHPPTYTHRQSLLIALPIAHSLHVRSIANADRMVWRLFLITFLISFDIFFIISIGRLSCRRFVRDCLFPMCVVSSVSSVWWLSIERFSM